MPKPTQISSHTVHTMLNVTEYGIMSDRIVPMPACGRYFCTTARMMIKYAFSGVIMLTTESQDSKKQAGRAAGATGWIVKPFRPEQLLAVGKKVLG